MNEEFDIPWLLEDAAPAALTIPASPNRWPPQLVFDLALGLDTVESILLRHDLTHYELDRLYQNTTFQKELARLSHDLREDNTLFKSKAKAQAETYLETMDGLMHDDATPAATKHAIFQTLTKLAELEPAPKKAEVQATGIIKMVVEWATPALPPAPTEIDITPA